MTRDDTYTIHAPKHVAKKGLRLHSLQSLKAKKQIAHELFNNAPPPKKNTPKPKATRLKRLFLWTTGLFISFLLIICLTLAYLTSPMGEPTLTSLIERSVNYIGKPLGLRIQLATIRGFWQGKVQIYDLRVYDPYGPWLYIDEGTLHPQWSTLVRGAVATWQYRQNNTVDNDLRSNLAPIATLSQNHETIFVQDSESLQENKNNAATALFEDKDIIDPLLTARQVLQNSVTIGLRLGTLVGAHMPRLPKYESMETEETYNEVISLAFLPAWLSLDIGEIELVDFKLGPSSKSVSISARLHGQISEKKLRLRTSLLTAPEISAHLILPTIHLLPADMTLTLKQFNINARGIAPNMAHQSKKINLDKYLLSVISLDYDQGDVDFRWQCKDSFLTPIYLAGVKNIWSRARIQARLNQWPPSPESPLQARFISRFGLKLIENEKKIRSSLTSGQLYWDNSKLIVRDFNLQSPVRKTSIQASGSLGYTPQAGLGTQLGFDISDINILATALGAHVEEMSLEGRVKGDFYASRGDEYMLWWAKPLPDFQKDRPLPGFTANPFDYSIIAKNVQKYTKVTLTTLATVQKNLKPKDQNLQTKQKNDAKPVEQDKKQNAKQNTTLALMEQVEKITHSPLPKPSKQDTGLRFRLKIEIPDLRLPQGRLKEAFFTVHGTSADASTAPAGTNYPRKAQPKNMDDFTANGTPRGLVGTTFLRVGDIFGLGAGTYTSSWFVGGVHLESDVFQARITDTIVDFPGVSSTTDLSFAFALPMVKRRWPWVDGNFAFTMENSDLLERIFTANMHIQNLQFVSSFKSFLDETGTPAQYMNTAIAADRIDATQFMVRQTMGKAESKHLHALADTLALSIGKLRDALTKKMEYTPPKDYRILDVDLNLAAGRGGPIRWNQGYADMYVAGEDAHFNVKMFGDINALLEGLFHFRTRTLKLKDMKISTPQNSKK